MWTHLPLVAALALTPAQPPAAGGLNLTNPRNTYGELGGTRPEAGLLPCDVLFVGFDIENITIDPAGQVKYTMAMEVTDVAAFSTGSTDCWPSSRRWLSSPPSAAAACWPGHDGGRRSSGGNGGSPGHSAVRPHSHRDRAG